jgi:putative ABC transport system ATP-binding protein
MTSAGQPVLSMETVSKVYPTPRGSVTVLRSVNLALGAGEFATITGPSGSGKTTLLNLAALLDRPTSGKVWFRDQDVSRLDEPGLSGIRKHRVGMVFQRFCLLSHRTVLENVLFRFRYLDVPRTEAMELARAALAHMGLAGHADQPARLLSGGEMQRTAIARAVALPPELLLVDEPTGNLDQAAAHDVMCRFVDLNRRGMTILLATHNPALLRYGSRHFACRNETVVEESGTGAAP